MPETIDHKAREDSRIAILRMDGHERQCTERWEQSRIAHNNLASSVSDLKQTLVSGLRWSFGLVLVGMGSVILLLVNLKMGVPGK